MKNALALSFISIVSSSSLPPRAGLLFVTVSSVAPPLIAGVIPVGTVVKSPLGTFEFIPPPTL